MNLFHRIVTLVIKLSLENYYHPFSKYYSIRVTIPVISLDTKGFSYVRFSIQVMMRLKDILDRINEFNRLTTFCFVCFCGWRVLIYRGFLFLEKSVTTRRPPNGSLFQATGLTLTCILGLR